MEYDEADVKFRIIMLLTHLFDQNKMDDEHLAYWVNLVKDAKC